MRYPLNYPLGVSVGIWFIVMLVIWLMIWSFPEDSDVQHHQIAAPSSKELAAVSCPGAEPIIVDGWSMRDGHITFKKENVYFITPNTCWLVVSPRVQDKEASK